MGHAGPPMAAPPGAVIGTEEFTALMTAEVPADITDELIAAIDKATDPEDDESTA